MNTISFKALYVVSLRRPTAAFLLKPFMWCRSDARLQHFFESPLCGVAQTPDCGISFKALYVVSLRRPTAAFLLKPFMWCRSDARLQHFFESPLCGVAQTPDCGISFKALSVVSLRRPTVAFLLKPFMWCRSDARLWHFLFHYPFETSLQTSDRHTLFIIGHCINFRLHMNNLFACIKIFI